MTILVTGGSGFLGLNLLRYLASAHPNATLVAADCHEPRSEDFAGNFHLFDLRDCAACLELFDRTRPTHVLHAAAVTLSNGDADAHELMSVVNVQGTANVLEAAVAARSVERCVILSSSGVYQQTQTTLPCDEDHPLDLQGTYARTKREAEMLMASFETAGGFPIVAVRLGPVFGPFERSRSTRPRVSLIQRLADHLRHGQPICIRGSDVHRDWTYAPDVALALGGLLFAPALNYRIYNVSVGMSISAREIIAWFLEQGLRLRGDGYVIDLDPQDSRKPLVTARLRHDTGFEPRFDLHAGLAVLLALDQRNISAREPLR